MAALRKDLGFLEATALAVSMMIGVGIFFGPSITAQEFPNATIILLLWIVGGAITIVGARVFGRLAAEYPLSGGPYVYLREAYGEPAAFLYAWMSFVIVAPVGLAVLATVFAQNLAAVSPLSATGITLLAIWCVAAFTFFNVIGVRAGGRIQLSLSAIKVVLVLALVAVLFAGGRLASGAASTTAGGGRFAVAFVGVVFAYGGWEYAVLATEEVRDAKRTMPRALLAASIIVAVLYILTTTAFLGALGPDGVANATALAPAAVARVLPNAAIVVAIAVAVSAAGTVNALVLLGPRATFAVGRDGFVPGLARVSARFGTPVAAILLQFLLASLYLVTGTFLTLATYDVIATALTVAPCAFAFWVFARRGVIRSRWLLVAASGVGLLFGAFLVGLLVEAPWTAAEGLAIIAAGLVPYAILRALRPRHGAAPEVASVASAGEP
ncbi:MAG: APC family permease [Thermoplasmatota archaeon]